MAENTDCGIGEIINTNGFGALEKQLMNYHLYLKASNPKFRHIMKLVVFSDEKCKLSAYINQEGNCTIRMGDVFCESEQELLDVEFDDYELMELIVHLQQLHSELIETQKSGT